MSLEIHRPEPPKRCRTMKLNLRWTSLVPVAVSLAALIICLTITFTSHMDLVHNETTCDGAGHIVPSISMSIGQYFPETYIWRTLILCTFFPRFLLGFVYKDLYISTTSPRANKRSYRIAAHLINIFYLANVWGLVILTIFDIVDFFPLHALAFAIWLFCSASHMLIGAFLHHYSGWRYVSSKHRKLFWVKGFMGVSQWVIGLSVIFSYAYYLEECAAWAHALFSGVEYFLVLQDIAFPVVAAFDLPNMNFNIDLDFSPVYELYNSSNCDLPLKNGQNGHSDPEGAKKVKEERKESRCMSAERNDSSSNSDIENDLIKSKQ